MMHHAIKPVVYACLLYLFSACATAAEQSKLPVADDLSKLGAEAKRQQLPILLLVSQYHCEYCDLMKREVLQPMRLNGDFQQQALMRELLIDAGEKVTNFQGQTVSAAEFADQYGVFVTPTLLFLDNDGHEAAERILGINTLDYLVFYIQAAIETAAKKAFGS